VIADGGHVSTVNLAEVLSIAATRGADPVAVVDGLTDRGVLGTAIIVEPFTAADAIQAARLRPLIREQGLSLADRACLALARRLGLPALTADQAWADAHVDVALTFVR
jgi:ribonuclease VapC